MKLYMHAFSTSSRPVRLLLAEHGIACDEDNDGAVAWGLIGTRRWLAALDPHIQGWTRRMKGLRSWACVNDAFDSAVARNAGRSFARLRVGHRYLELRSLHPLTQARSTAPCRPP